ncbi:MAG: PKD domain-containing protein [Candidatus Thermoplasmatota archaeon]|nr:PKD domain-containing protein [Candidatus Thermoplasmatota archaeon]
MRVSCVIFFIILASIPALPHSDASLPDDAYINISVVDASEDGISDISMAEGPTIAYITATGTEQKIVLASFHDGVWGRRTLWRIDSTIAVLDDLTYAIGPEGSSHIVFTMGPPNGEKQIMHGYSMGEEWNYTQLCVGEQPKLVIIDEGPLIVYRNDVSLVEAVLDGGFMPRSIMELDMGHSFQMAIAAHGDTAYLCVAYSDSISLWTRWLGSWSDEVIQTAEIFGEWYMPTVKVIGDRLMVSYRDPSNLQTYRSRIAERVDGIWRFRDHFGLLILCGEYPSGDIAALLYDESYRLNLLSLGIDRNSSMRLLDNAYLDPELHMSCGIHLCFPTEVDSLFDENGLHVALINVSNTYLLEHLTWSDAAPNNKPPSAKIRSDKLHGKAPLTVNITWEASDEDGMIVNSMAVMKGRAGELKEGAITLDVGVHRIRLFAWDDDLALAEASVTIEVRESDLFMEIRLSGTEGGAPYRVDLEAVPHHADGGLASCRWHVPSHQDHMEIDGTSASYTFDEPGLYAVFVTGMDGYGSTASSYVTIRVMEEDAPSRDLRPVLSAMVLAILLGALLVILLSERRQRQGEGPRSGPLREARDMRSRR